MKTIIKPKNSGKTNEAVRLSVELDAPIIVADYNRYLEIMMHAVKMRAEGLLPPDARIRTPIIWTDLITDGGIYGTDIERVIYDNADEILHQLASQREVVAITITGDISTEASRR